MNTVIEYRIKSVYGKDSRYIVDPVIAGAVKTLTGKMTLLDADMKALEVLGFTFKQVL